MNRFLQFNKSYFIGFLVLFITEVLIAAFLHDGIIRPYVGDYLVVILLYCFVQSFLNLKVLPAAIAVLIFSYLVEISQYFELLRWLGWENSLLARLILGNYFQWIDMLAYTLGVITVILIERYWNKKSLTF